MLSSGRCVTSDAREPAHVAAALLEGPGRVCEANTLIKILVPAKGARRSIYNDINRLSNDGLCSP